MFSLDSRRRITKSKPALLNDCQLDAARAQLESATAELQCREFELKFLNGIGDPSVVDVPELLLDDLMSARGDPNKRETKSKELKSEISELKSEIEKLESKIDKLKQEITEKTQQATKLEQLALCEWLGVHP